MKYLGIAITGFFSLSLTVLSAQVIGDVDILSQSYSFSAIGFSDWYEYSGSPGPGFPQSINYPINYTVSSSDGTPITYSANPGPPGLSGSIGNANISTLSFNTFAVAPENFGIETGSDGQEYSLSEAQVWITGQANYLFRPTSANQQITLNISASWMYPFGSQNLSVTLSDVTDSTTLLTFSENGTGTEPMNIIEFGTNISDVVSLDSGKVYELDISGVVQPTGFDYQTQNVIGSIVTVPEPGILSFASIYLGGYFAFRKRFRLN